MALAPFFSVRARERRAARAALRAERPESQVELVMPYPLPELPAGSHHEPQLLVASSTGISILSLDRTRTLSTIAWRDVAPLEAIFAKAPTMIPVITIGDQEYLGVHGSGTFALSIAQLRRMARRIERKRA